MNLIEFYKAYFKTLGIHVDENGGLFFKLYNDLLPISVNGLPAYLPTDENIKTAVEIVDGKPTPVKYIFNPLKEDAIKTNNPAFNKLKQIAELRALRSIYVIGEVLFTIMQRGVDVKDIELNRLIALIESYNKGRVKKIVDENTLTNWIALYEEILEKHNEYFYTKLNFKRGGTIDGVKYTRIGTIVFPFSEKLNEYNPKKETFLGVKLRNKDVHAYMTMLNYLFDNDAVTPKQFPTDNKISPNNIVLIRMFDYIRKAVNKVVTGFREIDSVEEDDLEAIAIPEFDFDINNLDNIIESLKVEINTVPDMNNITYTDNNATTQPTNSVANQTTTQTTINTAASATTQPTYVSPDPWADPMPAPVPPTVAPSASPWGQPTPPMHNPYMTHPVYNSGIGSVMTPTTTLDPWGM